MPKNDRLMPKHRKGISFYFIICKLVSELQNNLIYCTKDSTEINDSRGFN